MAGASAGAVAAVGKLSPLEQKALEQRVKDLAKKEKELEKKEKELKKREATVRGKEGDKNWPPCFPILYHSIEDDIPASEQRNVTMTYRCYLGLTLAFAVNFAAVTVAFFAEGEIEAWFLAGLYMSFGIPGAFFLWYMRYYVGARKDGALSYGMHFIFFICHILFCILATVGPPWPTDQALCGVLSMTKAFEKNKFTGVMYLIAMIVWFLETLYSIWVVQQNYAKFRGQGNDKKALRQATVIAGATGVAVGAAGTAAMSS